MFLSYLILLTALCLSAIAAFYSIVGLTAIFAAAVIPIIIMGGILEISKLVVTVWLHEFWDRCKFTMKLYLVPAVIVLMFITSMGIFGFLSKAHIEQTSASQESVAQVERINTEIARLTAIVDRAEEKITQLESSGSGSDANIQSQIDKEQERIDRAFERIQPAIAQQNKIIEDARSADGNRTKPFEDQLSSIQAEILRLENSAREYEDKIAGLSSDNSGVEPLLAQIAALEEEIIRVTNQLNSNEPGQVRAGQAIIGVTSDGLFGGNTRTALATWVKAQRDRITQIQGEVAQVRKDANTEVVAERDRLSGVVADIREQQIPSLKQRELDMLNRIDEIRQTESPVIATARDEIQRLRESAESQVAQSQALIERLRGQLAQTDKVADIDAQVDEQNLRIKEANLQIDTLTEQRYALEAEYRKLEAEVGPVKYIAEMIYGQEADKNLLEQAVRWVIIIIVAVFDPLAIMMLLAATESFGWYRKQKNESHNATTQLHSRTTEEENASTSAGIVEKENKIIYPIPEPLDLEELKTTKELVDEDTLRKEPDAETNEKIEDLEKKSKPASQDSTTTSQEQQVQELIDQAFQQAETEEDLNSEKIAKRVWKTQHPEHTLKKQERLYEQGKIDQLPWHELALQVDEIDAKGEVGFGTGFPQDPKKGDVWIRVDFLPTKLYKYNGNKWIEVDKDKSDTFAYNEQYIDHLINKIASGEYDIEMLNDTERDQIENRLKNAKDVK